MLARDIRYALRVLAKRPGFAIIAVLCLALGIGANAAIFSVVDGVLLRPLAFPDADRLMDVGSRSREGVDFFSVSKADFADWRDQTSSAELAAYYGVTFNFRAADVAERLPAAEVSANLLHVLEAAPALGRGFTTGEEQRGRGRVAILSDALWRRQFARSRTVLGKTIRLDGAEYQIIGVMPRSFGFPVATPAPALWVPMTLQRDSLLEQNRGSHYLDVVGRLRPGATEDQLRAEVRGIAARLATLYPATNAKFSANVRPLQEKIVGKSRRALLVLTGAVCCLLLIACANVANLLLARATLRAKEVAVRAALGASRARVLSQLLVEGVALALAGGAVGLLLAAWGTQALVSVAPTVLPRAPEIGVDWRVIAFTSAVSVLSGLLFGLAPALQVTGVDISTTLKEGGRAVTGPGSAHRLRSALVVAEVALSLVLLSGAALLGTTLLRLASVDPGFDPRHVLTTRLGLSDAVYSTDAKAIGFFERLLDRVRTIPGVESAGLVSILPLGGNNMVIALNLETEPRPNGTGFAHAEQTDVVSPEYFATAHIPLIEGRAFTIHDDSTAPLAVIVSESFAKKYWPGQSAIGKRLRVAFNVDSLRQVVGVVGDIRRGALNEQPQPAMYLPLGQAATDAMSLLVRTRGTASGVPAALRREVAALDPDQAMSPIVPMDQVVSRSLAGQRFNALVLGVFAVAALVLSAVGIFGVMSSMVARRSRELAVRMALGARPADVLRLVVQHGAMLTALGVGIGLAGTLALARVLTSLLYGVSAFDPTTFAFVVVLLSGVAVLASFLPAYRATRVDPAAVLQGE